MYIRLFTLSVLGILILNAYFDRSSVMVVIKGLHLIVLLGFMTCLLSCNADNGNGKSGDSRNSGYTLLKEICDDSTIFKEGFCDVFLSIVDEGTTDTSHIYLCKGLHRNEVVGLKIEIQNRMPVGLLANSKINRAAFIQHGVVISSIGKESDAFVRNLSSLYSQKEVPSSFAVRSIGATCFSMNEVSVDLDKKTTYKFKLFFEENSENDYAEIFLNIDLHKRVVELNEKDIAYRKNIVKVLSR